MKPFTQTSKISFPKINWSIWFLVLFLMESCEKSDIPVEENDITTPVSSKAAFTSFKLNEQTLETSINSSKRQIKMEIKHSANVKQLKPFFEVTPGYSVYANGVLQESGNSTIDLSKLVTYTITNGQNDTATWTVAATPLSCKIVIDASHDGGVWWFPQYDVTGYDPGKPHQGQAFANLLRAKGFEVTEIGRDKELTAEMFFGNYIVIRVAGFEPYTANEINVYKDLISRGMNLAFFTDHKQNDRIDELGDFLGLKFDGVANGVMDKLSTHEITMNIKSVNYIAGSVITNADGNPNIEILGWLRPQDYADLNFNGVRDANEPTAPPVMGILNYPKSKVFFIGDTNGLQVQPQPFIDNLIKWMGECVLD
jgi:hypothetical protein